MIVAKMRIFWSQFYNHSSDDKLMYKWHVWKSHTCLGFWMGIYLESFYLGNGLMMFSFSSCRAYFSISVRKSVAKTVFSDQINPFAKIPLFLMPYYQWYWWGNGWGPHCLYMCPCVKSISPLRCCLISIGNVSVVIRRSFMIGTFYNSILSLQWVSLYWWDTIFVLKWPIEIIACICNYHSFNIMLYTYLSMTDNWCHSEIYMAWIIN